MLPAQTSSQQTFGSIAPVSTKVASYSSEEGNTNNKNLEVNDLPSPSAPNGPLAIPPPNTPSTQSSAHAPSSNDLKVPQPHTKPQKTNEGAASEMVPSSVSQAPEPAKPALAVRPVAPVQPVAPPTHTVASLFGQSNGLMSQSAPLTASYNPSISAPNTGPMSRYFYSPSNSPGLFAPPSFYQPFPQTPAQATASPTTPKKLDDKVGPSDAKPEVALISAPYNVSI